MTEAVDPDPFGGDEDATTLGGRPTPGGLGHPDLGQLRLATAYADLLDARGESDLAHEWYATIATADPDDLTGVSEHFVEDDEVDDDDDARADVDDDLEDDDLDDPEDDELGDAAADDVDDPALPADAAAAHGSAR